MEAVGAAAARPACRRAPRSRRSWAAATRCATAAPSRVEDARQPDGYTYELACREGTVFDEARLLWHPI